ncbi:MAG: NAD(+) diphosphatase [Clostridia bacterium]|nr:NAD(+) diphosphatase [Clostridia bacterium]
MLNFDMEYKSWNREVRNSYWFLFSGQRLLVREKEEQLEIPFDLDLNLLGIEPIDMMHIGAMDEIDCYAASLPNMEFVPEGFILKGLRETYGLMADEWFFAAGRAQHLIHWKENHKFCGRCGNPMGMIEEERAVKCTSCDHIVYPRISPAIIVAVIKEGEILLARSSRFPTGMYSIIAGFVEPGETLEACVNRELKEEVGIEAKNIRYFASQPWPFPDSLMVGFTAEYSSGEIVIDNKEIVDANWFSKDLLPQLPGKASIARKIIDWYLSSTP